MSIHKIFLNNFNFPLKTIHNFSLKKIHPKFCKKWTFFYNFGIDPEAMVGVQLQRVTAKIQRRTTKSYLTQGGGGVETPHPTLINV